MSLQFITGNSGNGKTKYLFNRIVKEAKANPRHYYKIIVPWVCNADAETACRFVGE